MPSRKRTSQGDDAQSLPLREKRRRTQESTNDEDLEDSLSHTEEPIAKRALRSNPAADVPVRLNNSGSPELAKASLATASSKKSHVKFGSASPPPAQVIEEPRVISDEADNDEDEDSDDEAPDAISHSHAAAETKAAQAEEARRLKKQEQEEREKRRKRDVQLKAQVRTSEKRQRKADDEEASGKKRSKYDLDNLPNLLPDELLAIEAPERSPTPPPAFGKPKKLNGQGKARVKDDQGPADVVHKGTKIRVLQKNNSILPPKAKREARNIRESWMKGRASFQQVGKRGSNVATVRRRAGPIGFA